MLIVLTDKETLSIICTIVHTRPSFTKTIILIKFQVVQLTSVGSIRWRHIIFISLAYVPYSPVMSVMSGILTHQGHISNVSAYALSVSQFPIATSVPQGMTLCFSL